jgi:hypothetical protein
MRLRQRLGLIERLDETNTHALVPAFVRASIADVVTTRATSGEFYGSLERNDVVSADVLECPVVACPGTALCLLSSQSSLGRFMPRHCQLAIAHS